MDSAKLFAMNLIELRQGNEWAATFIKMIEARDTALRAAIMAESEGGMICEVCGNLIEDCVCEQDEDYGPLSDDIRETDYDGDGI